MKEIWKPIKGYEGLYEVSTFGHIRNCRTSRCVKPYYHFKGYMRVDLCKDGQKQHLKVHRIVAEAFIPNPDSKPHVNHRDFNRQNNRVWNLEWCTDLENKRYNKENSYKEAVANE